MKKQKIAAITIAACMIAGSLVQDAGARQAETIRPSLEEILGVKQTTPKTPVIASGGNEEKLEYADVCGTGTFKSWMDYGKITAQSTTQWRLQQKATTDQQTGIRMYEGRYMVAMARQYGKAGTELTIEFEDGQEIDVILGDIKAGTTCQHDDGSMIEFIVDSKAMPAAIKRSGNYNLIFTGSITAIKKRSE